jgi:hypothetical protein
MDRKNKVYIGIAVLFLLVTYIVGQVTKKEVEKAEPNHYGIEEGEIIAEIPNKNMVDVIGREGTTMFLNTYEVIEEKKYKTTSTYAIKNFFNYNGKKNFEKKGLEDRIDSLEAQVIVMSSHYEHSFKNLKRRPLCGVSTSSDIKYLKVNNNSVENIIEYKNEGNLFYIWYFSDLDIDPDEKLTVQIKNERNGAKDQK